MYVMLKHVTDAVKAALIDNPPMTYPNTEIRLTSVSPISTSNCQLNKCSRLFIKLKF
jgi:hypothetical protein